MDSPKANVCSVFEVGGLGPVWLEDIIINKPGIERRKDMALALSLQQSSGFMIFIIKKFREAK